MSYQTVKLMENLKLNNVIAIAFWNLIRPVR